MTTAPGDGAPDDASGALRWDAVVREAAATLHAAGVAPASREARWIFEEVTGAEEGDAASVLASAPTERHLARFDRLVARRAQGEPLQYVLGRWEFRRLDLIVDRRVLIPRPETESVAEVALGEIDRLIGELVVSYEHRLPVADLGTGSGALALAMATERTHVDVWATDVDEEALAVARANLAGVGRAATRVRVCAGDWFDALPSELRGSFGVIVTNPPYIAAGEPLPPEVSAWEPRRALIAGPTGLEALEALVAGAREWLVGGGALVAELAPHQAEPMAELARSLGYGAVEVHADLARRERVLLARTAQRR